MAASTIMKPKGVKVKICGKEYALRFTMASLAWLADRHGNVNNAMAAFASMEGGTMSASDLHALADLVCASMQYSDKEITPEYIEDNLDISEIIDILPELIEAFTSAMGTGQKKKKADPQKA
jgi:hypothetical protein